MDGKKSWKPDSVKKLWYIIREMNEGRRLLILRGDKALKGKPVKKTDIFKRISMEMRIPQDPDFPEVYTVS